MKVGSQGFTIFIGSSEAKKGGLQSSIRRFRADPLFLLVKVAAPRDRSRVPPDPAEVQKIKVGGLQHGNKGISQGEIHQQRH